MLQQIGLVVALALTSCLPQQNETDKTVGAVQSLVPAKPGTEHISFFVHSRVDGTADDFSLYLSIDRQLGLNVDQFVMCHTGAGHCSAANGQVLQASGQAAAGVDSRDIYWASQPVTLSSQGGLAPGLEVHAFDAAGNALFEKPRRVWFERQDASIYP